jgi:Holliday junction DNA helicase RuvA
MPVSSPDGAAAQAPKPTRKRAEKPQPVAPKAPVVDDGAIMADAVSALVNLGYGRSEAFGAVGKAVQMAGESRNLDTLIRLGLKELSA